MKLAERKRPFGQSGESWHRGRNDQEKHPSSIAHYSRANTGFLGTQRHILLTGTPPRLEGTMRRPVLLLIMVMICSGQLVLWQLVPSAQAFVSFLSATPVRVRATIIQGTINVRAGPGLGYAVIGFLRKGAIVTPIGYSDDRKWFALQCPKRICWITANPNFVKVDGDSQGLSVVSGSATTQPEPPSTSVSVTATKDRSQEITLSGVFYSFFLARNGRGTILYESWICDRGGRPTRITFPDNVPVARELQGQWVTAVIHDENGYWVVDSIGQAPKPVSSPSLNEADHAITATPSATATQALFGVVMPDTDGFVEVTGILIAFHADVFGPEPYAIRFYDLSSQPAMGGDVIGLLFRDEWKNPLSDYAWVTVNGYYHPCLGAIEVQSIRGAAPLSTETPAPTSTRNP
jgi:hypothetical protein